MLAIHRKGVRASTGARSLADFLTPGQRLQLATSRVVDFLGSEGGRYRLLCDKSVTHNIQYVGAGMRTARGGEVIRPGTTLCGLPHDYAIATTGMTDSEIKEAVWISQILLIKMDEPAFLRVAYTGSAVAIWPPVRLVRS